MIIDFHAHTFPDAVAARAIESVANKACTPPHTDGTVAGLKASMATAGVDWSVCLPVATNPAKVAHINDLSIASTEKDGLIYFGCMHPNYENYYDELARIKAAGLKGIKLHPQYQGVDITDVRNLRILHRAGELGLIVVIHAGQEPAYPGQLRASPEQVRSALKQAGPVTMICAHMGGFQEWDRVTDQLFDMGVYLDTGFALGRVELMDDGRRPPDIPKLLDEEGFCKLVRDFGASRVIFGTDCPWRDQAETIRDINSFSLTQEEKELIFYKNALRLLDMEEAE